MTCLDLLMNHYCVYYEGATFKSYGKLLSCDVDGYGGGGVVAVAMA